MVKVTCDRCGALYELDDASVPPSGKVMKCLGCGNNITVMPAGLAAGGRPPPLPRAKTPPPIPNMTRAGLGSAQKPGQPRASTKAGLGPADAYVGGGTDLADLPAPKRGSALAQAKPIGPAGNSRRAASLLEQAGVSDLPAPVSARSAGISDLPAPVSARSAGISDLPAPVSADSAGISDLPAPVSAGSVGISDLPAPVSAGSVGISDLPAPVSAGSVGISDLPAPVGAGLAGLSDLPAPVGASALGGLPDSIDLPAPVAPTGGNYSDLLAPVDRSHGPSDADLLAPVGVGGADLLAPVGIVVGGVDDLLAPVSLNNTSDLLAPKGPALDGGADLLAPKGDALKDPFTDLPAPLGAGFDNLPAPKAGGAGFDNLPAPKVGGAGGAGGQVAPKGFFDDIPAPSDLGGEHAVPAPKGFFDDIPAPGALGDDLDLLAPKGGPSSAGMAMDLGGPSGALDLDDLDLAPPSSAGASVPPLDLGAPGLELGGPGLDLDAAPPTPAALNLGAPGPIDFDSSSKHNESAAMPLELGAPAPDSSGSSFGDVELPTAASVVTFSNDEPAARPPASPLTFSTAPAGPLELDAEPMVKKATLAAGIDEATVTDKAPKKKKGKKQKAEKESFKFTKTHAMIGVGVLVLGLAGAGGFMFYQQRQEQSKQNKRVGEILDRASRQMVVDDVNHWLSAEKTATRASRISKGDTRAMGMAAQARFAAYLDRGTQTDFARLGAARKLISKLENKNARGDDVAKADALKTLIDEPPNPAYALKKLMPQTKKRGDKGALYLYLGWAHAAAGNHDKAVAAFQTSIQQNRNKTTATYWMGRSHLARGDAKAAREAFNKVRERDKNHIGALLGTYQLDSLSLDDRMKRYDGLLKRKDIKDADLRVRSLANSLIGDLKLESGGIVEARRRYDAALKLDRRNLNAKIGKAKAAFKLGRLDEARGTLDSLLKANPSHIEGTFVLATVSIAEGKIEEAQTQIDKVLKRVPPIQNASTMLRAQLIQGTIHQAAAKREKDPRRAARFLDSAIVAYTAAKKLVGSSGNIKPNVALTIVLTSHPDPKKRALAAQELAPIKQKASQTPSVAAKLGLAFLNSKHPAQAEIWFRTALRQTDNIETRFQLGVSLTRQRKFAEAIRQIDAAFSKNENREDIGLELAILYEALAQDSRAKHNTAGAKDVERKAQALYQRLLRTAKPSLTVRSRAGRFYARLANLDVEQIDLEQIKRSKALRTAAEKQGQVIVAEKRDHAAGQFLVGEGFFARGEFDRAKAHYQKAVHSDPDPQYLEALGRAYEHIDPPAYDKARAFYVDATKNAPKYLPPRYGLIRVRMKNQGFGLALQELELLDQLRPRDPWVWRNMGNCYLSLQKFPKAVAAFSLAVAYGDRNPLTSYQLGRAYFDDDRVSDSVRALVRATQLIEVERKAAHAKGSSYTEPKWTIEIFKLLGHAHRIRGEKRAAVRAWRQYLQRNPGNSAEVRDIKKLLKRLGAY